MRKISIIELINTYCKFINNQSVNQSIIQSNQITSNQINQISQINQINQINRINQINQINRIKQINQIKSIKPIKPIKSIKSIKAIKAIKSIKSIKSIHKSNEPNASNESNESNQSYQSNRSNQLNQSNQSNQTNQSIKSIKLNKQINQSINQSINCSVSQSINESTNQSVLLFSVFILQGLPPFNFHQKTSTKFYTNGETRQVFPCFPHISNDFHIISSISSGSFRHFVRILGWCSTHFPQDVHIFPGSRPLNRAWVGWWSEHSRPWPIWSMVRSLASAVRSGGCGKYGIIT